jgi:hypothetical protein
VSERIDPIDGSWREVPVVGRVLLTPVERERERRRREEARARTKARKAAPQAEPRAEPGEPQDRLDLRG